MKHEKERRTRVSDPPLFMFHVFTFHAAVYSDAMHVLYVHPNFPGQFGHIAMHLIKDKGWDCTFVTATAEGGGAAIRRVVYKVVGGARQETHFCSRTFENAVWN